MVIAYSKSSHLRKIISNLLIAILSFDHRRCNPRIVNLIFIVFLLTTIIGNGNCMLLFVISKLVIMLSGMSFATIYHQ